MLYMTHTAYNYEYSDAVDKLDSHKDHYENLPNAIQELRKILKQYPIYDPGFGSEYVINVPDSVDLTRAKDIASGEYLLIGLAGERPLQAISRWYYSYNISPENQAQRIEYQLHKVAEAKKEYIQAMFAVVVIPPLALLAIIVLGIWILRGFKRGPA